jgi:hypothetical protein
MKGPRSTFYELIELSRIPVLIITRSFPTFYTQKKKILKFSLNFFSPPSHSSPLSDPAVKSTPTSTAKAPTPEEKLPNSPTPLAIEATAKARASSWTAKWQASLALKFDGPSTGGRLSVRGNMRWRMRALSWLSIRFWTTMLGGGLIFLGRWFRAFLCGAFKCLS